MEAKWGQADPNGVGLQMAAFLVPECSSGGIGVHKRSATGRTASGVRDRIRQLLSIRSRRTGSGRSSGSQSL